MPPHSSEEDRAGGIPRLAAPELSTEEGTSCLAGFGLGQASGQGVLAERRAATGQGGEVWRSWCVWGTSGVSRKQGGHGGGEAGDASRSRISGLPVAGRQLTLSFRESRALLSWDTIWSDIISRKYFDTWQEEHEEDVR